MADAPRALTSRRFWGIVAVLFVVLMVTTNWSAYTAMGAAGAATANAGAAVVFGTLIIAVSKAAKRLKEAVRPGGEAEA